MSNVYMRIPIKGGELKDIIYQGNSLPDCKKWLLDYWNSYNGRGIFNEELTEIELIDSLGTFYVGIEE